MKNSILENAQTNVFHVFFSSLTESISNGFFGRTHFSVDERKKLNKSSYRLCLHSIKQLWRVSFSVGHRRLCGHA